MSFNRNTEEELFLIRPRFKLHTEMDKQEILDKIQCEVKPVNRVVGTRTKNRCFLAIPEQDQHYWSPEMQIEVSNNAIDEDDYDLEKEVSNSTVRVVIGPKQKIWAMFVFGYALSGAIIFFGGLYGLVQFSLDKSPLFLWCFPLGIIMIIGLYTAAAYGRKKGHEQMIHLIRFLYQSIDDNDIIRE